MDHESVSVTFSSILAKFVYMEQAHKFTDIVRCLDAAQRRVLMTCNGQQGAACSTCMTLRRRVHLCIRCTSNSIVPTVTQSLIMSHTLTSCY